MSELSEAINDMRNMREAYDQLAQGVITAPIVSELEDGKAAIIATINEMGGTATASMSMGELAQAIRALILVQLGELEFDRPIASAQEAANMLQDHCTKYVDDFTEIMDTPLIVDEWQAVEEVRYKKLLDYNFTQFSSDERKTGVYALTNCHNLKRLIFDSLRKITLTDGTSQFAYGNLIRLEEVIFPALASIGSGNSNGVNSSKILSGLSSLTSLSLPALASISVISGSGGKNTSQILSGCINLEYIEIGHTSIDGGSITGNMRLNINPTNIYEDAEKLAALNASIRDHWFANLYDYTGGTTHTLTLMSAFVAHLEPETIQVATDKNWTIVTF